LRIIGVFDGLSGKARGFNEKGYFDVMEATNDK
jgi:hypothetical protein